MTATSTVKTEAFPVNAAAMPKMGRTLCERTEKVRAIAHALHDGAKLAKRAGVMRCINTIGSMAGGVGVGVYGYCTSNTTLATTGAAMTVTAGLSLLEIISLNKDAGKLKELLLDTGANADMLKDLVEADQKSYTFIQTNLEGIQTSVETLNQRMSEIQGISQTANVYIDDLKKQALTHQTAAKALFLEAEELFNKSRGEIDKANQVLAKACESFGQISTLANSTEGSAESRLALFAKTAEQLSMDCLAGMVALERGNRFIEQGQKKMHEGYAENEKATLFAGRALEAAEACLTAVAAKAEPDEEVVRCIENVQKETDVLQERNSDKLGIVANIQETVNEALEALPSWLTASNICAFAGGPAVAPFVAPAVTLVLPSIAVPVAAGFTVKTIVHNRLTIGNKIYKLFHTVRDKVVGDFAPLDYKCTKGKVLYAFDLISTGWRKWIDKNSIGSRTEGDILIDLGNKTPFALRFHLGKKKLVKDTELKSLVEEMKGALESGNLSNSDCAAILKILTTPQERFGKRALISEKSASFFGEIRRSYGLKHN